MGADPTMHTGPGSSCSGCRSVVCGRHPAQRDQCAPSLSTNPRSLADALSRQRLAMSTHERRARRLLCRRDSLACALCLALAVLHMRCDGNVHNGRTHPDDMAVAVRFRAPHVVAGCTTELDVTAAGLVQGVTYKMLVLVAGQAISFTNMRRRSRGHARRARKGLHTHFSTRCRRCLRARTRCE